MASLYCSQHHKNPLGYRFCYRCGEVLSSASGSLSSQSLLAMNGNNGSPRILGMRYRIVRELGQGGFGRTYLAEDMNRFNERCVLKEFVPQVNGTEALQKAVELFEREAGVLYQLQHPQIPRFRELLRVGVGEQAQLFLVQDYVDGKTYRDLLEERKQQGRCFTEAEIVELLSQILPIIQYLHRVGVIHRDIAPDNLMLRESDRLPVLIDFGGVKQIAVAVEQRLSAEPVAHTVTRLGKIGYAPEEQMQAGIVSPSVDLYALGVTVLVLLTGKDPSSLLDSRTGVWHWQQAVQLSPTLGRVLDKMLAYRPSDRYGSATEVLQALNLAPTPPADPVLGSVLPPAPPPQPQPPARPAPTSTTTAATIAVGRRTPQPRQTPPRRSPPPLRAVAPPPGPIAPAPAPPPSQAPTPRPTKTLWPLIGGLLLLTGTLASIGLVWWLATQWEPQLPNRDTSTPTTPRDDSNPANAADASALSSQERSENAALRDRQARLKLDQSFFISLVDNRFYTRYPEQRGKQLSASSEDEPWRRRWREVADDLLDQIEDNLGASARQKLGSYSIADTETWQREANQIFVGSRSLNDLADTRFFQLFPELQGQDFLSQPVGQIWYAIADEQLQALKSGRNIEELTLRNGEKSVRRSLNPGVGKIYLLELKEGQSMEVELEAPSETTQLSIYLPRPSADLPFLLSDSSETQWSGSLSQSGYYEVVVVSIADKPFDYRLSVKIREDA